MLYCIYVYACNVGGTTLLYSPHAWMRPVSPAPTSTVLCSEFQQDYGIVYLDFCTHFSAPGTDSSASTNLHCVKLDHSWPRNDRSSRWYRSPRTGFRASVASSA